MQVVKLGPRQFAFTNSFHGRPVAVAPAIRETCPVDGRASRAAGCPAPRLTFSDNRSAPIDHSPEGVEDQAFTAVRTCPLACPRSAGAATRPIAAPKLTAFANFLRVMLILPSRPA